ncbi:MAG: radical SAM protein [Thermodesulfobacteriota bacterium]
MSGELAKKVRYGIAFARRGLIHTNLQLLYRCNFRCRICDFWREDPGKKMLSVQEVGIIAEKLSQVAPQIISIGGGEPLLHPDIVAVVRVLARKHFPVMICNGWFVTPENARALFSAGMYEISVSVDYADPRKHDEQRGGEGAFHRAVRALSVLGQNRVKSHQRVHMISVVMDDNLDEIEPLIRLSKKIGVTYLVTLYSDGRGAKKSREIHPDVSAHLLALKKKYPGFVALTGYLGRFSEAVEKGGIGPCYAGRNLCNVDNYGNISPCIDCMEPEDRAGNLLTDDMGEIVKRLRARFEENRCRACWTSCRGSIESILYGKDRAANLMDYWRMVRPIPVARAGGA